MYQVIDAETGEVKFEAKTKGLCNQWLLDNYTVPSKRHHRSSVFKCDFQPKIRKKLKKLKINFIDPSESWENFWKVLPADSTPDSLNGVASRIGGNTSSSGKKFYNAQMYRRLCRCYKDGEFLYDATMYELYEKIGVSYQTLTDCLKTGRAVKFGDNKGMTFEEIGMLTPKQAENREKAFSRGLEVV